MMRILLDECLPKDFAGEISDVSAVTVQRMGWAGISNGKLLRLISDSNSIDVFVTMDKNLPQQQQIMGLPFAIVVLRARSNRMEDLLPLIPTLMLKLHGVQPGHVYEIRRSQ